MSQIGDGHGFLIRENIRGLGFRQRGPLCPQRKGLLVRLILTLGLYEMTPYKGLNPLYN